MNRFGKKSYTLEEATRRLERYCAYQERCHQEVVQKLKELGMIPEAIDQIVVHLIGEGFLNEGRFAMAFAWGKFNQKYWGRNRIERELAKAAPRQSGPEIAAKGHQPLSYSESFAGNTGRDLSAGLRRTCLQKTQEPRGKTKRGTKTQTF